MEQIAEAVNGQWTLVWSSFDHPAATDITAWARLDPDVLALYVEHYASVNVISQGIERVCPDALVTYSHQVISDSDFEQSEYYNDYFKPNGLFYAYGMKVDLGLKAPAFISSVRPKSSGPFGANEGLVFETLLPHLQRAMKLHVQFSELRSNIQGLECALDSFSISVFGLDATGSVVLMNQAANQLLQSSDGVSLRNGRLTADDMKQNVEFQLLMSQVVAIGVAYGYSRGGALLVNRASKATALRVTVTPVPSKLIHNHRQLAGLVFIADPASAPLSRSDTLRALYGLSPSEGRLADLLAAGLEVAAASEILRWTVDTTRFHLKSIFRKTGTNRQTDLVRLVLGVPGLIHSGH